MSAPTLSILVYNTHRRHLVCDLLSNHHLLHTLDILLLQEPPLGLAAPPDWVLLPAPPGGVARSVALVRKKWAASTYAQVAVASHDVVALDLRAGGQSVRVIGVYNPHQGDRQNAGRSAREIRAGRQRMRSSVSSTRSSVSSGTATSSWVSHSTSPRRSPRCARTSSTQT